MNPKYPGTGRGSSRMQDSLPFFGEKVLPWGRRIQISAIWAPIRRSGGCPGDEIAKSGAHCFRENPKCRPIAGFAGFTASKKGLNRPNWRGNISPHGLLDVEMTERGYGVPVRDVSTRETLAISALTRHTTSPHSPTWEPGFHPVGRRENVPDPAILGDEIAKNGSHCFAKSPIHRPFAGFVGIACPEKGPNRPNWRGDKSPHGLLDVETGKHKNGDPTRHTPKFRGPGEEWEENTNDRKGRNPT